MVQYFSTLKCLHLAVKRICCYKSTWKTTDLQHKKKNLGIGAKVILRKSFNKNMLRDIRVGGKKKKKSWYADNWDWESVYSL